MQDGQFHVMRGVGDCDREHAGVLVVDAVEVDPLVGLESRETEPFPRKKVLRLGECDTRTFGGECGVGHDVAR